MATEHGQLIPKYQHPSETTFIFDNTVVSDTEDMNDQMCRMLFVFASPKGRDNKLLEKRSLSTLVEEYGYPDYKRYGQPYYMPYTALSSGNATGWCMRVMPNDATYSNVIYAVKLRKDTETDPETGEEKNVMHVLLKPYSQEGLTDAALFSTYMETLKNLSGDDEDGYDVVYPYIGFRNLGRGKYGQYFRMQMSHDVSSDRENSYKNYNVSLISTESGTVVKETFTGINLTEDAVDPKTGLTTYISDVINDYEGDGSKMFSVEFKADYHQDIFKWYKENIDPNTELTAETFDIFGYDRTRDDGINPHIEIDDGGISSVALFSTTGISMASGDDGSLDYDKTDSATREQALEQLYVQAFDGAIDKKIKSKLRAPCNVCLDANYPLSVKKQLIALTLKRGDMLGYVDSGLLTTVNQVKTFMTNLVDIDTYYISKNAGMFSTKDSVTGKVIPVTITMWLAYKIPMHWAQKGLYIAMAAEDYAMLSGYTKNSVYPEIDQDDEEIKEEFYKARWNYIECIDENVYVRGTQQTCQKELSDLSEENNVHVMLQVKRRLERLCAQKRYKFGEASDRKIFTEDANELFSSWKNVYLRDIKINFTMTPWEERRSILHCTCEIIFLTLIKRSVIEIDINPRA